MEASVPVNLIDAIMGGLIGGLLVNAAMRPRATVAFLAHAWECIRGRR